MKDFSVISFYGCFTRILKNAMHCGTDVFRDFTDALLRSLPPASEPDKLLDLEHCTSVVNYY